jgi:hypothetical protein
MDPELEQDERNQDDTEVYRAEPAPPDVIVPLGVDQIHRPENDEENQGGGDQRLDPHQFGAQHFPRQCMIEIGRHRGPFHAIPTPPSPQHRVCSRMIRHSGERLGRKDHAPFQ